MNLSVQEGTIEDVLVVYPLIPEFSSPHKADEYALRFVDSACHLILVAYDNNQPVGFKVGYQRDADGSFYSWMGGVALSYRRYGIAKQLADAMEQWCVSKGYHSIRFKTRNRHKAVLCFSLKNGFNIIGIVPAEQIEETRIWLEKRLI